MRRLGFVLTGIWLLLTGLSTLVHIRFEYRELLMSALAVVAGIMLILQR
ncbi:hypothetical protein [Acidihalobacter prosperus]|uniref:Uncharacterized protein n=1 Tax=Acidihalobacter prosperus TaxID=160660 RepID=A0A1A6C4V8_9GAMM|nr:hypothetical protein [Acidihalobacter prosperus]OBS09580.1 hypothetical protein Thpro_021908 [Acidihalobacter prosperus]